MSQPVYQVIVTADEDKATASKRRAIYLRPFLLFWLNSLVFEVAMLIVSIAVFSGWRSMFPKLMWTIVFCPLGMGGAMGGLINAFIVDRIYGRRAVHFVSILSVLVLGGCNNLCYNLDLVFGWFGAQDHFWWWHWRYLGVWFVGYFNGRMMFTDEGQKSLAGLGV
ncbi:hypothetical protein HER10_EVM0010945 [Colletotrichum scovillei]|uniref:Uncharacterized protein n=1 Tax=Colletotrichum scovillei TaxID=1209932 RepID=A0A9P7UDT4_9PEZI|nr:uncharacterized protein HER10_EVM0010945 [Colletotrichum scovillei]KAF4784665.1 hypothetical protein HER10_EVM0010945 [Colletotrichum scovillei]KAG7044412.1 hypothetical protein JMJ77_0003874 [Colletotrichum scovillei]KAG7049123.1 hypothetical protein JMJ78_0013106 [Colletotrichum scovillei]KAG7063864.1 hypothetical protein JMJ76_0006912 [Colletotrichum scovillei]